MCLRRLPTQGSISNIEEETGNKKPETATTTPNTPVRRSLGIFMLLFMVVIIEVVVFLVLTREDDDNQETPSGIHFEMGVHFEAGVHFETGVLLVTYYCVNTTVTSHLARTILTIVTANALDCASIHRITMQLPLAVQVVSLKTMADDG
jgi:hypothetical protein